MSKSLEIGERHPHVILLTNNMEDYKGVCELISSQVSAFRTIVKHADIYQVLIDSKPSIVLLGYSHISSSVQLYAELIEKKLFNYNHKTILLCDNKESGIAFKCCSKGLFDDYFVHKPMYENFRLRLILQKALQSIEGEEHINRIRDEHFGKIDADLSSLIDRVIEQQDIIKKSLHNTKLQTVSNINKSSTPKANSLGIEPELYNILREEYLDPLISALEGQLSHNIIEILGKLKSNKQTLKNCSQKLDNLHQENLDNKKRYSEEILDNRLTEEESTHLQTINPPQQYTSEDKNKHISSLEKHVMVVDDNEMYREMICKVLRDAGYNSLGVENGKLALDLLKQKNISAIFMDLYMPSLDGYNTTKYIRNIQGYEKLPIIALTGNKDKEMIRKWAEQGLNGYIVKPATKFAILDALKKSNIFE
ncbi:MAG: response regulator [Colwellia sp.]